MDKYKKYENKYISIMGDSISTFEGFNPPNYAVFYDKNKRLESNVLNYNDTWWGIILNALKSHLCINNSYSGSLVSKHPLCEIESYGCSNLRCSSLAMINKNPDIIIFYIGTNDWGMNVKLFPNDKDINDLSYFNTAYDTMIKKVKINYPNSEILCCTLPLSIVMKERVMIYKGNIESKDFSINDYNLVIKNCAINNNCIIIDLNSDNFCFDTFDGLHPNKNGMLSIANKFLEQL